MPALRLFQGTTSLHAAAKSLLDHTAISTASTAAAALMAMVVAQHHTGLGPAALRTCIGSCSAAIVSNKRQLTALEDGSHHWSRCCLVVVVAKALFESGLRHVRAIAIRA